MFAVELHAAPFSLGEYWLAVSGIRIYTSGNVEAVNGTDVRLKCTFQSSAQINPSLVVVSWTFRPLAGGQEISLFHYQQQPYPPLEGIFRKKILWAGDLMGGDASIIIREVKLTYNGTYICQVKNPPDVHGPVGEIQLRVVLTGKVSSQWTFIPCCLMIVPIGIIYIVKRLGPSTEPCGTPQVTLEYEDDL
uniref:Myelin protein zero like 2 n=1 Tax=Nothobranchius furzeri TaxID=105023 RepID=A0A8C6M871_NOTFU